MNKLKELGRKLLQRLQPLWQKLQPLRQWILVQWHRIADWYQAQQEVIKQQSEISHERITIKRAVLAFMETWGLGSRNIFYTSWHLLWRPGYLMSDYLNGRRQSYMQPFFMFFVLTLIVVEMAFVMHINRPKNKDMTLMAYETIRDHKSWFSPEASKKILNTARWIDAVHDWRDENRAWDILIQSLGAVLVTWLLWRKSPRIGTGEWVIENGEYIEGYNFAEIVTVIAFILCQMQLITMLALIFFHRIPFDHMSGWAMLIPKLILFVLLLIDFKQLFRRDWWPTAWRSFVIVLFV